MKIPGYTIKNGIYFPADAKSNSLFENHYITVRSKENRIYTNEEVKKLPSIASDHIHSKEWHIRQESSQRLTKYLEQKNKPLKILEAGCGNGWLSHQLSKLAGSEVTGLDINYTELQQAANVFGNISNVIFVYGDILTGVLPDVKPDIIVFAASIQYFSSLTEVINNSLQRLNNSGEIHILDTNFYKLKEVEAARQRTRQYYQSLSLPEMTDHYFHHTIEELQSFNYKLLYNPNSFVNKAFGRRSPFPWFCIKKQSR